MIVLCLPVLLALHSKSEQNGDSRPHRKYVHDIDDFRLHTLQHRHDVFLIGIAGFEKFRHLFPNVHEETLLSFLNAHDLEKTATLDDLKKIGYTGERTFLERLYDYYNVDNEKMSAEEKAEFNKLRDELNRFAGRYQFKFFFEHKLISPNGELSEEAKEIILIERIADLVDRDENVISLEEFNRAKMKDAKDYFEDPQIKSVVAYLEENYLRIVPPNPLVLSYRERFEQKLLMCGQLFAK